MLSFNSLRNITSESVLQLEGVKASCDQSDFLYPATKPFKLFKWLPENDYEDDHVSDS